jgi:hypothetical protein
LRPAVVEGQIKANILDGTVRADIPAVSRFAIDIDNSMQSFEIRVVPDTSNVFVTFVANDLQHRIKLAIRKVSKVIRVLEQQRAKASPEQFLFLQIR